MVSVCALHHKWSLNISCHRSSSIFMAYLKKKNPEQFEWLMGRVDEFLENERYMGRIGVDVYPVWRTELRSIFGGPVQKNEHIIRGGVGTGKTTVGVIEIMYICYKVFCLRDPQKHLGQVQGSPIVIGFFNLFKYLSKSTALGYLTIG